MRKNKTGQTKNKTGLWEKIKLDCEKNKTELTKNKTGLWEK